jgi:hypothetical protein
MEKDNGEIKRAIEENTKAVVELKAILIRNN